MKPKGSYEQTLAAVRRLAENYPDPQKPELPAGATWGEIGTATMARRCLRLLVDTWSPRTGLTRGGRPG